jgi:D-glycero-D-manno-heptose 1,7-bisphosphate phosphatase
MSADVLDAGGRLDALYFCPHHPQAIDETLRMVCDCRKPRPGMIHQATTQFEIDLNRSFVVGDKLADVGLAASAGARGILVRTGYGQTELQRHHGSMPGAAYVADTSFEAASWILKESGFPKETR